MLVLPCVPVSQFGCSGGVRVGFPVCNWAMWNSWSCFDFCIINSAFLWSHSTLKCILAWILATATSFVLFTWNFFSSSCFCAISSSIFATSENLSMMFLGFFEEGCAGVLVVGFDDPACDFVFLVGLPLGPVLGITNFSFLTASFSSSTPMSSSSAISNPPSWSLPLSSSGRAIMSRSSVAIMTTPERRMFMSMVELPFPMPAGTRFGRSEMSEHILKNHGVPALIKSDSHVEKSVQPLERMLSCLPHFFSELIRLLHVYLIFG